MVTAQNSHLIHLALESAGNHLNATFNALGARQVALSFNGRAALQPYELNGVPPFATGFVMAPWSNRMRDGKWSRAGEVYANPVTETSTNTALHGLLLSTVYAVVEQSESSVTFEGVLEPSAGYPFSVTTRVRYELVEDGLEVTHSAVNHSAESAPYGTGAHPYLYFEGLTTADLELRIPARSWTRVDERLLPVSTDPVVGGPLDTSGWVRLGDFNIDNDFLDLDRDSDGLARTVLRAPASSGDPRVVEVWQDQHFSHVHVFSTPNYPAADGGTQRGLTIEPVTAGPDAFNTGLDLLELSTGVEWRGRWGIKLLKW